jgi:hypothetical protein
MKNNDLELPLHKRAEIALKQAVTKLIAEHKKTGDPLVIWRNGKVEMADPHEVVGPDLPESEPMPVEADGLEQATPNS